MIEVRLMRLQADYEAIRELVRRFDRVKIESVAGSPPERYRFLIKVNSLRENGGRITLVDEHKLEVRLPTTYPREGPFCRMLTPVFHPNIAPHQVCIGDYWAAGESLEELLLRICSMLAYQSYNVKSPLNGEAAEWVESHLDRIPLETTSFVGMFFGEPAADLSRCENCQSSGVLRDCSRGHHLCSDCLIECGSCSGLLCLVCGETRCPVCQWFPEEATRDGQNDSIG